MASSVLPDFPMLPPDLVAAPLDDDLFEEDVFMKLLSEADFINAPAEPAASVGSGCCSVERQLSGAEAASSRSEMTGSPSPLAAAPLQILQVPMVATTTCALNNRCVATPAPVAPALCAAGPGPVTRATRSSSASQPSTSGTPAGATTTSSRGSPSSQPCSSGGSEDLQQQEQQQLTKKQIAANKRKAPEVDWRAIEDPAERRRQRRLAKNRVTAARSRERKKEQWGEMEAQLTELREENQAIKAMMEAVLRENAGLKEQLASLTRGASPACTGSGPEPAVLRCLAIMHLVCLLPCAKLAFRLSQSLVAALHVVHCPGGLPAFVGASTASCCVSLQPRSIIASQSSGWLSQTQSQGDLWWCSEGALHNSQPNIDERKLGSVSSHSGWCNDGTWGVGRGVSHVYRTFSAWTFQGILFWWHHRLLLLTLSSCTRVFLSL